MAPEMGVNIVALYLDFRNDELIGEGEHLDTPRDVTWYSLAQPENSYAVLDGIAYMYNASADERKRIRNAGLGKGPRYYWKDSAQGDGLMFILALPENYTVSKPAPLIKEVKEFKNRLAVYWFLRPGDTREVGVRWSLKKLEEDLESEVGRIMNKVKLYPTFQNVGRSREQSERDQLQRVLGVFAGYAY